MFKRAELQNVTCGKIKNVIHVNIEVNKRYSMEKVQWHKTSNKGYCNEYKINISLLTIKS